MVLPTCGCWVIGGGFGVAAVVVAAGLYAARVCWRIGGHVLEGGRGCTPHTLFMGLVVGVVHCTGLVGGLLRTSAQLVL